MEKKTNNKIKTGDLARMSLFTALMCLCAWLSIPAAVPFTLQTFAVFLAVLCLGAGKAALVIAAYLLLGFFGLPVFSGAMSGPGVIFGANGGYMLGWFLCPAAYGLFGRGSSSFGKGMSLFCGLVICYICGTLWYSVLYAASGKSLMGILSVCVFPFVLPDIAKLALALAVSGRINNRTY